MKKTLMLILSFFLVLIAIASCANSNPTTATPATATPQPTHTGTFTVTNTPTATATQTGLFVEKADIIQAQTSHGIGTAAGTVMLRYGNSTGVYVHGATVSINSTVLTETTVGKYTVTLSNVADDTVLDLSISSLAGNATASINAPYDCEITSPADGIYQSAAATLAVNWRPYIVSGILPQKRRLTAWRLSDSQFFHNSTAAVLYAATTTTIPANVLPDSGIIYIRAFGINEGAIVGANGGSVTFSMENSENTRYVNMLP